MQRFAHWTNLSETTFVLPPDGPRAPTTACASSRRSPSCRSPGTRRSAPATPGSRGREHDGDDVIVQECAAGLVHDPAHRPTGSRSRRRRCSAPARSRSARSSEIAGVLRHRAAPRSSTPQWADNGPGWVAVLLANAEAVLAAPPELRGPRHRRRRPASGRRARGVRGARVLPQGRLDVEDPVTGSLNASLAEWLLRTAAAPTAPYVARQGTALGRAGRVHVDAGRRRHDLGRRRHRDVRGGRGRAVGRQRRRTSTAAG